jgi:hypothetical protein
MTAKPWNSHACQKNLKKFFFSSALLPLVTSSSVLGASLHQ